MAPIDKLNYQMDFWFTVGRTITNMNVQHIKQK